LLPKLPGTDDGTKLWDWLLLFKAQTEEELTLLERRNQEVSQVVNAYRALTKEDIEEGKRWDAHKQEMDHRAWVNDKKREARKEGLREGREAGMREGKREGKREGVREGIREGALMNARSFLRMGLPASQVAEGTGLSIEEVNALKS